MSSMIASNALLSYEYRKVIKKQ